MGTVEEKMVMFTLATKIPMGLLVHQSTALLV